MNKKRNKSFFKISLKYFGALLIFGAVVATAIRVQNVKATGPNSTMAFAPSSQSVAIDSDFTLVASITPNDNLVNAISLHVAFDGTRMNLISIVPTATFATILSATVPNPTGIVITNAGSSNAVATIDLGVPNGTASISAPTDVATFTFNATGTATNSPISFNASTGAAAEGEMGNVVISTTSAAVTITSDGPTFTINEGITGTAQLPVKDDTINITVTPVDPATIASQFYAFSSDNICNSADFSSGTVLPAGDFHILGNHSDYLCVKATDSAAAISYQYIGQLHTDNTAPVVAITAPVISCIDSGCTNNVSGNENIVFTDTETTDPQCSVDNIFYVACISGATKLSDIVDPGGIEQDWANLTEGAFTLYVKDADVAGNSSSVASSGLVKDTVAPAGGDMVINNDDANTTTADVTLNITCPTDSWTTVQVAYGNTASPANWTTCTATKTLSLLGLEGSATVYARFRDGGLNTTADITDTITYTDVTAPIRSAGSPSGTLSAGTTQATMALNTDENATCKYATTAGADYSAMTDFTTTGAMTSSFSVSGLTNGTNYAYYVKCQDEANTPNINVDDYIISFGVGVPPAVKSSDDSYKKSSDSIEKRHISNSRKIAKRGLPIIQRGKKFSKNSLVLLYFGKYGGGFFAPDKIMSSKSGSFSVTYKVPMNKHKGTYYWYAVDTKSGKKSKTIYYRVR